MTSVVVDSSVVIKWFDAEPYAAEAERILLAYEQGTLMLLAPDLLPAEVGNIIWKKHTLLKRWSAVEAQEALAKFQALTFTLAPTTVLLDDAYHLAVTHQRTVYDSLYLALSLREQCPFITADERFVNAVQNTFPQVIWIANWI
ncbi:MAG TPA: type II toxin-antitoxin system VapC family toxin [Herpetosiphonaceae bacterium]